MTVVIKIKELQDDVETCGVVQIIVEFLEHIKFNHFHHLLAELILALLVGLILGQDDILLHLNSHH
jgi:hypothetical protein